jgi:Putative adhesin
MPTTHPLTLPRRWLTAGIIGAVLIPWSVSEARPVHEQLAVDPRGSIEIVDVAGSVALSGWDRPEIEVTGSAGDEVDRVEVSTSGGRSVVRVISRSGSAQGGGNETRLTVHVPAKSAVMVSLVSADLALGGLQGSVQLRTVSGAVTGDVGGDLRASTVSGSVRVTAAAAKMIEVKTVSGTIHVSGSGGEVEISTISGDATLDLESITRGRFKSVSGGLTAGFALVADGRFEGESVSGNLVVKFAGTPAAEFDVQSVSGSISNCFGPKPKEAQYGPGSRLAFKSGEGNAHVQIETKSGNVSLCTRDSQGKKDSQARRSADAATVSGCGRSPMLYKVDETEQGDRPRRFPLI